VSPPAIARRVSPDRAALVGYAQHRPNLGNVEGQCPSILLQDNVPDFLPAIDALRPDQADAADLFVRSQMGEMG
ncbi:MAG: phytanoyl-CoA dioxygenase family protein, partial [Novosphingobium sp.]